MPSVSVDVDVDLNDICDVDDLKLVVGYAMLAPDAKIKRAAEYLNDELCLGIAVGDEHCPEPSCDRQYREWWAKNRQAEVA